MICEKDIEIIKKDDQVSDALLLDYAKKYISGECVDTDLDKTIKFNNIDKSDVNLIKDILWSRYVGKYGYQEYVKCGFANMTKEERKEYIGVYEFMSLWPKWGTQQTISLFENKYETYKRFEDFYKRDIIKISNQGDIFNFLNFCKSHCKIIIKPLNNFGGQGIKIIDTEKQGARTAFAYIIGIGGAVVEEIIDQDEQMANYHPNSVNTVRVVTYTDDNNVEIMYALLRVGTGGNNVDNTTSGGLAALIDIKTGKIITKADALTNKTNISYANHPDTNVPILDSQIPMWEELLKLVNRLAQIVPEQKYVGWDLALSKKGWIMVEGNYKPLLATAQMLSHKGFREKYKHIMPK